MKNFRIYISILLACLVLACSDEEENAKVMPQDAFPSFYEGEEVQHILVLGDIQNYTKNDKYYVYFHDTVRWIEQQLAEGANISSVIFTGDITSDNYLLQWERFKTLAEPLSEKVPLFSCIGNHDYTWGYNNKIDRNNTHFNEYLAFESSKPFIVAAFEEGKMENIVVKNTIWGERYDFLILEFGPRTEVVEWAKEYVSAHTDTNFILLTHEYLSEEGELRSFWTNSTWHFEDTGTTWTYPEKLWEELVFPNDNILCVLCGHSGLSEQLFTPNCTGRMVPQIQLNLEYVENGAGGLVQIWSFYKGDNNIRIRTYNTITGETLTARNYRFAFRYK